MLEIVKRIEKILGDKKINAFVYELDGEIVVEINWGDWKHDHSYADYLIQEEYPDAKIKVYITEEDGSDSYSANHYISF